MEEFGKVLCTVLKDIDPLPSWVTPLPLILRVSGFNSRAE
jgi:hypothetical protein